MNLTVLGNKLLLEMIYDEEKGGILLPDIAKKKPNFGIVHAFGKTFHEEYPDVVKGNRIAIRPYGNHHEYELNGKLFMIVDASYVVGVVE